MSKYDLLKASKNGDVETVRLLLASKKFDVNMEDILNQNHLLDSNLTLSLY